MKLIGIIAALASAASWGFGTVMFDRLGKKIPYAGITFLKGAGSIVLIGALALVMGGFASVTWKEFLFLALSGIIGISVGDTLFFKSLQDLGAKVQVLYFLLGQVVTMFLSLLFLGEVLSLVEYIGATVLLIGIVVVTWGKQEDHPNKRRGIIGGFLSILCFSLSNIMVKMTIGDVEVVTATFYRMLFGTIAVLFAGLTSHKLREWIEPLKEKSTLLLFVLNLLVITFGGFLLSMAAIKNVSVSLVSVLMTTESVFVLIFAYLINKEKATGRELVGAAVSIIGLLLIIING